MHHQQIAVPSPAAAESRWHVVHAQCDGRAVRRRDRCDDRLPADQEITARELHQRRTGSAVRAYGRVADPTRIDAWRLRARRGIPCALPGLDQYPRSEEHTYELQSLMRISYDVFC